MRSAESLAKYTVIICFALLAILHSYFGTAIRRNRWENQALIGHSERPTYHPASAIYRNQQDKMSVATVRPRPATTRWRRDGGWEETAKNHK